jgi:hypothetical protein
MRGGVSVLSPAPITLTARQIDATSDANLWGTGPLGIVADSVLLSAGRLGSGAWRDLSLADVTLASGGRIDAGKLRLTGLLALSGGQLDVVAHADSAYPVLFADPLTGARRQIFSGEALALAADTISQAASSRIVVGSGATLALQASAGGSVTLTNVGNDFSGGISVLSGPAFNTAWRPNLIATAGPTFGASGQGQVSLAASGIKVAGAGLEGDVINLQTGRLLTDAPIVARLPYDSLVGIASQYPGLSLGVLPAALGGSGLFGGPGSAALSAVIGAVTTGNRLNGPNGGWVRAAVAGSGAGSASIFLSGPLAGSSPGAYQFLADNVDPGHLQLVYNDGNSSVAPGVANALSTVAALNQASAQSQIRSATANGDIGAVIANGGVVDLAGAEPISIAADVCAPIEGSVNCASADDGPRSNSADAQLRGKRIEEVGKGRSATQGRGGAKAPEVCVPVEGKLECGSK